MNNLILRIQTEPKNRQKLLYDFGQKYLKEFSNTNDFRINSKQLLDQLIISHQKWVGVDFLYPKEYRAYPDKIKNCDINYLIRDFIMFSVFYNDNNGYSFSDTNIICENKMFKKFLEQDITEKKDRTTTKLKSGFSIDDKLDFFSVFAVNAENFKSINPQDSFIVEKKKSDSAKKKDNLDNKLAVNIKSVEDLEAPKKTKIKKKK